MKQSILLLTALFVSQALASDHILQAKRYNFANHPYVKEEDEQKQDDPISILRYMVDGLYGIDLDRQVGNVVECIEALVNTTEAGISMYEFIIDAGYETLEDYENWYFNISGSVFETIPHAIYECYIVDPTQWEYYAKYYEQFVSLNDFESAFLQNIVGQILTLLDIYDKIITASEIDDMDTMVYQMGRLVRKLIWFESTQGTIDLDAYLAEENVQQEVSQHIQLESWFFKDDPIQAKMPLTALESINQRNQTFRRPHIKQTESGEHVLLGAYQETINGITYSFTDNVTAGEQIVGYVAGILAGLGANEDNAASCELSLADMVLVADAWMTCGDDTVCSADTDQIFDYAQQVFIYLSPAQENCYYAGKSVYQSWYDIFQQLTWNDLLNNFIYNSDQYIASVRNFVTILNFRVKNSYDCYMMTYYVGKVIMDFLELDILDDGAG